MNPRRRYRFIGRALGRYWWETVDPSGQRETVSRYVSRFWAVTR